MRKYDVCIFDLDGTLIDSLDDLADSCNKALKIHGLPTHNIDKYEVLAIWLTIMRLCRRFMTASIPFMNKTAL